MYRQSLADALELFGSAPVDALVLGPYVVRRPLS